MGFLHSLSSLRFDHRIHDGISVVVIDEFECIEALVQTVQCGGITESFLRIALAYRPHQFLVALREEFAEQFVLESRTETALAHVEHVGTEFQIVFTETEGIVRVLFFRRVGVISRGLSLLLLCIVSRSRRSTLLTLWCRSLSTGVVSRNIAVCRRGCTTIGTGSRIRIGVGLIFDTAFIFFCVMDVVFSIVVDLCVLDLFLDELLRLNADRIGNIFGKVVSFFIQMHLH